jgi:hypothetical protein
MEALPARTKIQMAHCTQSFAKGLETIAHTGLLKVMQGEYRYDLTFSSASTIKN